MQRPGNQVSLSSSQRWLRSNELKTDRRSKIASAIRLFFAFRVTYVKHDVKYLMNAVS